MKKIKISVILLHTSCDDNIVLEVDKEEWNKMSEEEIEKFCCEVIFDKLADWSWEDA